MWLIYPLTKVSPGKQRGYYTQPYYRVPAIPHRCQCPSVSIKRGSDVLVARVALDPTSLTLVHQGRHLDLCVLAESERQYSKTFIFTVTNFYYCISFQFRMVGRKRITGETASISVFWTIYWVSYFLETTHELFFFFFLICCFLKVPLKELEHTRKWMADILWFLQLGGTD